MLLGREQGMPLETRVARWAAVYPKVRSRLEKEPEVIDLRYPNGFAVRSTGVAGGEAGKTAGPVVKAGHRR